MKLVTDLSLTGRPPRPARGPRDPSLVLDFVAGRFTPGGFGQTIQFARATTASFHDASGAMQTAVIDQPRIDHDRDTGLVRGLLVENARTNLLLNAATPVTQTVSVTAALHALSFRRTGTITLSGAHSASLTGPGGNVRAVLVFTPAAGALTLTVSGDVQMAQLEAGNCATSFIPTAGAPAQRAWLIVRSSRSGRGGTPTKARCWPNGRTSTCKPAIPGSSACRGHARS